MIYFLRTNPKFAQAIGFDPINNFVPSEATFSVFKKKFDTSLLFEIIAQSIQKGIDEGIFDPNNLCIDSYPISFRSFSPIFQPFFTYNIICVEMFYKLFLKQPFMKLFVSKQNH